MCGDLVLKVTRSVFIPFSAYFPFLLEMRSLTGLSFRKVLHRWAEFACLFFFVLFLWLWLTFYQPGHLRTGVKVAYFLRMSEGNRVKRLQCLDCEIVQKRSSVSQTLLPLLKCKWQDRPQRSVTAPTKLPLCKTNGLIQAWLNYILDTQFAPIYIPFLTIAHLFSFLKIIHIADQHYAEIWVIISHIVVPRP